MKDGILYGKVSSLNAGLGFRIFVQSSYDHFRIGLRFR